MTITLYIKGKRTTVRLTGLLGGRTVVTNAKGSVIKSFKQLEEAHHVAERLALRTPGVVFNFFLIHPRTKRQRFGIGVKKES